MENFDLSVFKAYDIRGTTPDQLTPELARAVGSAFARWSGSNEIAIGRDCRLSSPALFNAMSYGITGEGVDVIDLGEVPTDAVYFVSGSKDVPGVMITASHNPPQYNGIKLCRPGARPVGEDSGLGDIRKLVEQGPHEGRSGGVVTRFDPIPGYVDHLLSVVEPWKIGSLKVAADGGNGMAGVAIERVFERISAELTGLYLKPDGTFPHHPADPLRPENVQDLIALVVDQGMDVGVAFDGDADRAFFVDDTGKALSGSTTTALIARWFLAREPGATIVHNLITSRAVEETIRAHGGVPVKTRVGHSFIKKVMEDTGAVFGGEHSGHYYFRANFRADSGMLAMLVLLQVISEDGRALSEIRKEVEPYVQSGEINLHVDDTSAAIDAVAAAFPDAHQDRLDGLTVEWDDRWFNVRPSNTEPVVRLNVEGPDQASVDDLVARVRAAIGAEAGEQS